MSLLELAPQCCDAGYYQDLAIACSNLGNCYDDVRPVGSILWFSIPYALGLPFDKTIPLMNFCLLFLSTCVASMGLSKHISLRGFHVGKSSKALLALWLFPLSFCIHFFWVYPSLRVSLSDAPAGMLATTAVWLVLFYQSRKAYTIAGLLFGLSAWIRVFYLYPVFVMICLALLFAFFARKKLPWYCLVFSAALPVSMQFVATWNHHHSVSYLEKKLSNTWQGVHLSETAIGYDTIVSARDYRWRSSCKNLVPPIDAIQSGDYQSLACVIIGRLDFYLGSYSEKTYSYLGNYNELLVFYNEDIGNTLGWQLINMDRSVDAGASPDGKNGSELFWPTSNGSDSLVRMWTPLVSNTDYTLSVWLWSHDSASVKLRLGNHQTGETITEKNFSLTKEPYRYSVTGHTSADGNHDIDIVLVNTNKEASGKFYAWGSKLERGVAATEYADPPPEKIRHWSAALLAFNITTILLSAVFMMLHRKNTAFLVASIFVASSAFMAVIIVPEQRFFLMQMIVFWHIALLLLPADLLTNYFLRNRHKKYCPTI